MSSEECVRKNEIKEVCPCPKTDCANHHTCCQCIAAHRQSGKLTYCMAELAKK